MTASEKILQMRITRAQQDAIRAIHNKDPFAYVKACAIYKKNDALLRELENERNARAVEELEGLVNREGYISPRALERSGIPGDVMRERGWSLLDSGHLFREPNPNYPRPRLIKKPAETRGREP